MLKYIAEVCAMAEIRLGDRVRMRKTHPCGSDEWTVIRIGADIKIKCPGCGRIVMMERADFIKRRKNCLLYTSWLMLAMSSCCISSTRLRSRAVCVSWALSWAISR